MVIGEPAEALGLTPARVVILAVQLAGYRWLMAISADALGTRFESLRPLIGQVGVNALHEDTYDNLAP